MIFKHSVAAVALTLGLSFFVPPAQPAEPIKVGFSVALTGGVAVAGKQVLQALELWQSDINAKGGLLGRTVEFVHYDDQSNPALVPGIYTKLIEFDRVDLLIGPYDTNLVAAAIPVLIANDKTTIGLFANAANSQFHYSRYFSMLPTGPEPKRSFSTGLFELARRASPEISTVAILAADSEFAQNAADGARENAKAMGFKIVYDSSYPPATTDYAPIVRALKNANADIIFVAAYPPDTVGVIRAVSEVGLRPKLLGGLFVGLLSTPIRIQLGALANGIVNSDDFPAAASFDFPGLAAVMKRYQAAAPGLGIDPMGYAYVPLTYAAGQILAEAVSTTKSLDQAKIADYMRSHTFHTVAGEIAFGKDGEWVKSRMAFVQFRHLDGSGVDQYRDPDKMAVVWPPELATGKMIYPYAEAMGQPN